MGEDRWIPARHRRELAIADARKSTRRATTADSDAIELAADPTAGPAENVSTEQVRAAVRGFLDELPQVQRDREILLRFYLNDEDEDSICAGLGVDSAHFNRVLFGPRSGFASWWSWPSVVAACAS